MQCDSATTVSARRGRGAHRPRDRRAGQEVVVLEHERGPVAAEGGRREHRPHAPGEHDLRAQRAHQPAQLAAETGDPQRRGHAVARAGAQVERPLAQCDQVQPGVGRRGRERALGAGDRGRLVQPARHLEQDLLGAPEQARVAHEERGHATAAGPRSSRAAAPGASCE